MLKLSGDFYDGWVLANGVRTHYAWAGTEGPAVILLHGAGPGASGAAGWKYMLPALAKAGFRAFAPDQLSMGWTDVRPHAWPTRGLQSLVDHIRDFVEALCLDEVSVVGNSQGAYVAAKYAIDNPHKVNKLFLIGSATIAFAMGLERPKQAENKSFVEMIGYDFTKESMVKFLKSCAYDQSKITDDLVEYRHAAATRPGIREAMQAFSEAQRTVQNTPKLKDQWSLKDSLPNLKIPTKFIWGKQDTLAPIEMAYQLEKLLPNISFEYIDECGHQCQTDQPELVNQMVIDFFKN